MQQRDGLAATVPLDTVAWHDVYAPFLKWAGPSGRAFHPFAYDWRRGILETTGAFTSFLDKVSSESGGARIQVVAHSMGGLITFAALHWMAEVTPSIKTMEAAYGNSLSKAETLGCLFIIGTLVIPFAELIMDDLLKDVRHSTRMLLRTPSFS